MPMNFPNTPANGDNFQSGGVIWAWNGAVWNPTTAPGGTGVANVTISDAAPVNPVNGNLWWNSSPGDGQLYCFFNDGSSSQWVVANNVGSGLYLPTTGGTLSGPITVNLNTVAQPPLGNLHPGVWVVGANGTYPQIGIDTFGGGPYYIGRSARGTPTAPTAVQSGDILLGLAYVGYGATGYLSGAPRPILATATENWTDTAQGSVVTLHSVANGTNVEALSLTLQGNTALFPGGVGIGAAAIAPGNGMLRLNANTVTPPPGIAPNLYVIGADGSYTNAYLDAFSNAAGVCGIYGVRRSRGTAAAPLVLQAGDLIGSFGYSGYNGTGGPAEAAAINSNTTEIWSATANGAYLAFYSTPAGTASLTQSLVLNGNYANFFSHTSSSQAAGCVDIAAPANVDSQVRLDGTATSGGHMYNLLSRGLAAPIGSFWIYDQTAALTRLVIDTSGNTTFMGNVVLAPSGSTCYLTFNGAAPSGVNSTGGPFIYSDTTNTVYHLGSGNGNFIWQDANGNSRMTLSNIGGLQLYYGVQCKSGIAGAYQGNYHNISWSPAHLWIDNVDQGSINITPSDVRLKKNICPATYDTLAAINAIALKEFDFLATGVTPERHYRVGFIAQQLIEAIPEAVTVPDDPEQMLGVQLMPIVSYLIGAVQQLSRELEALKGAR